MQSVWIIAALTTGLVGSLHCVGMCGPLAMALPVGRLPRSQRALAVGLYHLSRVTAYAGLGTLAGTLGQGLLLAGFQRSVSVGAGLLLLFWTVIRRGKFSGLTTSRTAQWISQPMSRFLKRPTPGSFAGLGLLNGWLPCGFVYVALTGAVTTGSAIGGAAYMGLFGLGTVPALVLVRFIPELFPAALRRRFTAFMPVLTVVLGLLLLARGACLPPKSNPTGPDVPICHGGPIASKPTTP